MGFIPFGLKDPVRVIYFYLIMLNQHALPHRRQYHKDISAVIGHRTKVFRVLMLLAVCSVLYIAFPVSLIC
jgi:hypothetical protein